MANGTWKIARGKGSPQLSIAIVAVLAVILVLLGRAQSTLFDHARTYFSDATSPLLQSVRVPVNAFGRWVGSIDEIFSVYRENLRLKEENARLRQWQNAALVLEQRINRYQLLLNAVPDPSLSVVTAHVIGRANRPFLDTMILDAGKNQGVKSGEAVVDARGMIGRIYLVGQHTSWVILLTDLNSRIPVAIEPGHAQAILSGDNSESPTLELSKQGVTLKEGEQIVTSGDGGLLPGGIAIGTVFWDGSEFRAGLLADSATADDVRILDLKVPPEQPPAPSPNDLPVSAAGLSPLPTHAAAGAQSNTPTLPPLYVPPVSAQQTGAKASRPGGVPPGAANSAAPASPADEQDH